MNIVQSPNQLGIIAQQYPIDINTEMATILKKNEIKKSILVKDEYFEYNYHFKWSTTCIYIVLNLEVPLLFVR